MRAMYRVAAVTALLALGPAGAASADSAVRTEEVELPRAGSVSCGAANRGKLARGVRLPARGPGYVIPEHWRKRHYNYGTRELVGLLQRAARRVATLHPGAVLGVADLSKKGGGTLYNHRSHQSGRDVDLHYYALDRKNRPLRPDRWMPYYLWDGRAIYAKQPYAVRVRERFFDLARNWALVRELLTDKRANVTHIFASYQIKKWLLDYAKRIKEPPALIGRAVKLIMQPPGSPHNDHMHVRIGCPPEDVRAGLCRDENWPTPARLLKKKRPRLYYHWACPKKPNT